MAQTEGDAPAPPFPLSGIQGCFEDVEGKWNLIFGEGEMLIVTSFYLPSLPTDTLVLGLVSSFGENEIIYSTLRLC